MTSFVSNFKHAYLEKDSKANFEIEFVLEDGTKFQRKGGSDLITCSAKGNSYKSEKYSILRDFGINRFS
jgi:hypothetical protein